MAMLVYQRVYSPSFLLFEHCWGRAKAPDRGSRKLEERDLAGWRASGAPSTPRAPWRAGWKPMESHGFVLQWMGFLWFSWKNLKKWWDLPWIWVSKYGGRLIWYSTLEGDVNWSCCIVGVIHFCFKRINHQVSLVDYGHYEYVSMSFGYHKMDSSNTAKWAESTLDLDILIHSHAKSSGSCLVLGDPEE